MRKLCHCLRCGWDWHSRVEVPKECPKCHCREWWGEAKEMVPYKSPMTKSLDALEIMGSITFPFHWLPNGSWLDERKNLAMHQMIGRHAKNTGRQYHKQGTSAGLIVTRIK